MIAAGLIPLTIHAATTQFFASNQVATLVSTGVTYDTISSGGYLFTYTRDKLFTGGIGLTNPIGRRVRVPWPQGVEAQAVTAGTSPGGAEITLQRADGLPFDLRALTFKLLANTAGAGGSMEIMPQQNGEDALNDPLFFDATGYYGNQFTYTTAPNNWGSTARLTNYPAYKMKLYVDFALTALTLDAATPNHAPTNIVLAGDAVLENELPGTYVGTFATGDPDPGDVFTYALVDGPGGADNALFFIAGGDLYADASFNFEAQSTYNIRVESRDQGDLATEQGFVIHVIDADEPPPALVEPPQITPDGVTLRWDSLPNHTYAILVSTDLLAGFTVIETNLPPGAPVASFIFPAPDDGTPRFWMIETGP